MRNKVVNAGLLIFGTMLVFTQVSVAFKPGNSSGIEVRVLPIIYGMPHPEDTELEKRGGSIPVFI